MDVKSEGKWCKNIRQTGIIIISSVVVLCLVKEISDEIGRNDIVRVSRNLSELSESRSGYRHVWPDIRFGWEIVVGGIIGFAGAAFGSVGGLGGGAIFVPMLTLIIGFDEKSSTAISKCMVMGGSAATVLYNIGQKHPTLEDKPIIDYDLALLFQPLLMLGISLGVAFNVIFPDWLILLLLIFGFLVLSFKSFTKGIKTWKNETIKKKEAVLRLQANADNANSKDEIKYNIHRSETETKDLVKKKQVTLKNIYWKQLGLLVAVWVIILVLQITKSNTRNCSPLYWMLNFLQIPVTLGVSMYEAVSLCKGSRVVESKGEEKTEWRVRRVVICFVLGILAGMVGGMLGVGGGFILAPLFLELQILPQVSSATATLIMFFSSSTSVVEFYLLRRFPVPYALYFTGVAVFSAIVGQYVAGKVIKLLGRASLIIFILSSMIFISGTTLGGVGIANTIKKIHRKEYMGFEDICMY